MRYILQLLVIFVSPWILNKYFSHTKVSRVLSPVVLAYLIGILIAMFNPIPLSETVSKYASELSIMLAIPLLLFNADIMGFLRQAKGPLLSFCFAIFTAIFCSSIAAFIFRNHIIQSWDQAGMLIGVLTGGTANMQAVAVGIKAEELFIVLNAAEIFWGGILLLILTSFAHPLLGKFLPEYEITDREHGSFDDVPLALNYGNMFAGVGLGLVIVLISLGSVAGIFGNLDRSNLIIIFLTTLGVLASFNKKVRSLESSFVVAEYLLLVFCVAAGMRTDFLGLIETGGNVVVFAGFTMIFMVILFVFLSWLAKIDRDTTIMMITATIYGPAFIGQIAKVINNRQIIFMGMACGIMGYVVGNYAGMGMSYLLEHWISTN